MQVVTLIVVADKKPMIPEIMFLHQAAQQLYQSQDLPLSKKYNTLPPRLVSYSGYKLPPPPSYSPPPPPRKVYSHTQQVPPDPTVKLYSWNFKDKLKYSTLQSRYSGLQ